MEDLGIIEFLWIIKVQTFIEMSFRSWWSDQQTLGIHRIISPDPRDQQDLLHPQDPQNPQNLLVSLRYDENILRTSWKNPENIQGTSENIGEHRRTSVNIGGHLWKIWKYLNWTEHIWVLRTSIEDQPRPNPWSPDGDSNALQSAGPSWRSTAT